MNLGSSGNRRTISCLAALLLALPCAALGQTDVTEAAAGFPTASQDATSEEPSAAEKLRLCLAFGGDPTDSIPLNKSLVVEFTGLCISAPPSGTIAPNEPFPIDENCARALLAMLSSCGNEDPSGYIGCLQAAITASLRTVSAVTHGAGNDIVYSNVPPDLELGCESALVSSVSASAPQSAAYQPPLTVQSIDIQSE
jgi:hypothetical protein